MKLNYQGLVVTLPMDHLIQIESFTFHAALNEHGRVTMKLLMEEGETESAVQQVKDGDAITVRESDERILFRGKLIQVSFLREKALNYLFLEAVSYTYDWELEEISQSFCDLDATYLEVAKKVVSNQSGAVIKDGITKGKKIPHFLLQYEESDWTFLKRLASHFESCLVPDVSAQTGQVFFGLPGINDQVELTKQDYLIAKNMEQYYQFCGDKKFTPQETVGWRIETKRLLTLGEEVLINQVKGIVTQIQYEVVEGVLTKQYEIRRKKGVRVPYQKNPRIYGMSIPAVVKERNGNCVRVHFDIDPVYEAKPNNQYFTYAIETSSMYCMPEEGSKVHIYFPSHLEQYAIAVNAIRTTPVSHAAGGGSTANGGGGGYASNPDYKSFSNVNGAELLMTPENLSAAADAKKETILYLDGEGTILCKGKNVTLTTETDLFLGEGEKEPVTNLTFMGKQGLKVNIGENDREGLTLDTEVKIMSTFLKMSASERTVLNPSPSQIASEMAEEDKKNRDAINANAQQLVENKIEEGRNKIKSGITKILTVVATVAVVVATGGAGAMLAPMLVTGGIAVAFAAADIAEGSQDYQKGMSGDLTQSFHFFRDGVFGGGELGAFLYELAKNINDIVFGVVTGKALAGNLLSKLENVQKLNTLFRICDKTKKAQTISHIATNLITGVIGDFAQDGKIDPASLFFHTALGFLQGQIGSKLGTGLGKLLGGKFSNELLKKGIQFASETGVDTVMDFVLSKITGQDFNVWESLLQNTIANGFASYGGEPVEVGSGAYVITATDLILPDIKEPIEIRRQYLSAIKKVGTMGRGWRFCYDSQIYRENKRLHVCMPTGHEVLFQKKADIWVTITKGCKRFQLSERKARMGLQIEDWMEHKQYLYDLEGRLTVIKDANGQELQFFYNQEGLCKILTPCGNTIDVVSAQGKILQITDELNRVICYRYRGNLLTDVVHMDQGITHYSYDEKGYLSAVTDQNGVTYLKNTYDETGRVLHQELANGETYDMIYEEEKQEVTYYYSGLNRSVTYEYNKDRLVTRIQYADGSDVTYAYDDENYRIKEVDQRGNETKKTYHPVGVLLTEQHADGYQKTYHYNKAFELQKETDNGGRACHYTYDTKHQVIKKAVKLTERHWQNQEYCYDDRGRLLKETGTKGILTYTYEGLLAKPTQVIDGEGNITSYTYDRVGRMLTIQTAYGTVEFGYNSRNFITSRIDGMGEVSQSLYDKMGNLIAYYAPKQWKKQGPGYLYRYDAFDRRIATITPTETIFEVERNGEGDIVKELYPNHVLKGEKNTIGTSYEYDEAHHCIRIHSPEGGTERFFYDSCGNRIKHVLPEAYDVVSDDGVGYQYTYDEKNRLSGIYSPEGILETSYTYDYFGQVIKEEGVFGTILYEYNGIGACIKKQELIRKEKEEAFYQVTVWDYNAFGDVIKEKRGKKEVREGELPEAFHCITFAYDTNRRRILAADDTGAKIVYRYDCLGNVTYESYQIEEGIKKQLYHTYDACGRKIQTKEEIEGNGPIRFAITTYEYDENGNLIKQTMPKGGIWRYTYDAANRLVKKEAIDSTCGIHRILQYSYDAAENLVEVKECAKGEEARSYRYTYDYNNRFISQETKEATTWWKYNQNDALVAEIAPEEYARKKEAGAKTKYQYDARGNLTHVFNALGELKEQRSYDAGNRLTQLQTGESHSLEFEYTFDGNIKTVTNKTARKRNQALQTYCYNSQGQIIGIVDGRGAKTEYEVDGWGRITSITAPEERSESYTYNYAGQIASTTDGNGNKIQYRYNSLGKVREIIDPTGAVDAFFYDEEGNLIQQINRNGTQIHRTYAMHGGIIMETAQNAEKTKSESTFFTYNGYGEVIQARNSNAAYEYQYDTEGRLKEKRSKGMRCYRQTFNRNGQLAALTDRSGATISYYYDLAGRLRYLKEKDGSVLVSYTYDRAGQVTSITYQNGLKVSYQYDEEGNLSQLELWRKEVCYGSITYWYDGNGNRIKKKGSYLFAPTGIRTDLHLSYRYDSNNQLVEELSNEEKTTYVYDKAGNRIEKKSRKGTIQYLYNPKNQLTTVKEETGNTSFTYDASGCMIKKEDSDGMTQYTYNPKQQLTSVVTSAGDVQKNWYDPEGLRTAMLEQGTRTEFIFWGEDVLTEERNECSERIRYFRGYGIEGCDWGEKRYYYAKDEQLSTFLITGMDGRIVNQYRYDSFGWENECEETIPNRFRYTGQQYDSVTEQYYLRARYYSPALGRFLQEDVYRGDGLNLYAYCRNNPVMYYDPSGYGTTQYDRETKRDTKGNRMGDEHYNGWLPKSGESWKLPSDQMGAHLYERKNVSTRNDMKIFDIKNTPTYYPYGNEQNAGQAHLRLHDETRNQGIKVRGNPGMTDVELIRNFFVAYSTPHLQNIKGYLGVGKSGTIIKSDVTPLEAFIELNKWGMNNDSNFKNLMNSLDMQTVLNEDPEIQNYRKQYSELDKFIKNNSSVYDAYKRQMEETIKKNGCGGN